MVSTSSAKSVIVSWPPSCPKVKVIGIRPTGKAVVAEPPAKEVTTPVAGNRVVLFAAKQPVGALSAKDNVRPRAAIDAIVSGAAVYRIGAIAGCGMGRKPMDLTIELKDVEVPVAILCK
jgi:hypothetical protein